MPELDSPAPPRRAALDRLAEFDAQLDALTTPQLNRRGRLSKWDRPKPPFDWRWWIGNLGKTLIAAGLLMFGFVAYQLWGTGIETARAQNQLRSEFEALLVEAPSITAPTIDVADGTIAGTNGGSKPTDPATSSTGPVDDAAQRPAVNVAAVPVDQQNIPQLENGDVLARLEIPRIGVDDYVVAGVDSGDLKRGPGHFPDTPLPGQLGNAAVAGHRTTYGAPFFNVDELQVGDDIIATTLSGRFTYRVTGQQIVDSNDYWVVATTDPTRASLTLTSCDPKYTAKRRIVVFSELVASESAPVGEPVINYGRPAESTATDATANASELPGDDDGTTENSTPPAANTGDATTTASTPVVEGTITGNVGGDAQAPGSSQGSTEVSDEIVDAFSEGWFSDPGADGQVGLWGALLAAISIGAYLVSRKLRRDWAGALIGIVPFLVTLYFFFQNVNRLLPPNL